ncbi:hypothetical protein FB451DRAFT_1238348 [Mycena latifolia]|nr:hypothetical protein FB451DRAFT_1238348 [Mycena latifolia]
MDSQTDPDRELMSQPEASSTGISGAFFPNGKHFVVSGGNFTNIVNAPPEPSDFRMIPLGDLILEHEIRSGIVYRRGAKSSVKRVYTARVAGRSSNMTVAVYHGPNAEDDWKDAIQKYSGIRHPNIAQLFGTVKSAPFYATIFHDDLIPFEEVAWAKNSPLVAAYLDYYLWMELPGVISAFTDVTGIRVRDSYSMEGTLCVHRSNSRMCFDMSPTIGAGMSYKDDMDSNPPPRIEMYPLDATDSMVISSISSQHYHEIVARYQVSDSSSIEVHPSVSIPELGTIVTGVGKSGSLLENPVQVAAIPNRTSKMSGWHGNMRTGNSTLMPNGWTRYKISDAMTIGRGTNFAVDYSSKFPWVTQANHIFSRLGNPKKYGKAFSLLREVMYGLDLVGGSPTSRHLRNAYIFLCPDTDLRREDQTGFRHPVCPAYWSFDPLGIDKLDEEDSRKLGFPTISLHMNVWTYTWSRAVYGGIRKFHQGKGFDPDSQDVAVQLGVPLYELSPQRQPGAGVDEEIDGEEETEDDDDDDVPGPPSKVIHLNSSGFTLSSDGPRVFQLPTFVIDLDDESLFAHVDDLGSNDDSESGSNFPSPTREMPPHHLSGDDELEALTPEHNEIGQQCATSFPDEPVEDGPDLTKPEKPIDIPPSRSPLDRVVSLPHWKMWFFGALGLVLGLIVSHASILNSPKIPASDGSPDKSVTALAIERAQTLETWLDDKSLVTFIEILERDQETSQTYNALHRGSVRAEWVRRKLGI